VFVFIYSEGVAILNECVGFASVSGGFSDAFVLITYYWVNFVEAWVDRTSLCVDTSGEGATILLSFRLVCSLYFSSLVFYSLV
jgi:hypothetical protein